MRKNANLFFHYTERAKNDAYFTRPIDAEFCVNWAMSRSPKNTQWIEPFAGKGDFLDFLPLDTVGYDIEPKDKRIIQADSLKINWDNKVACTNIPYYLKNECIQKALSEAPYFWTICSFGILNNKNCFVDEVVLFEYGNWSTPRSYLKFDLSDGREKMIYCGFFKVCRLEYKREVKQLSEQWRVGANNIRTLDNRFYIRCNDHTVRKAF